MTSDVSNGSAGMEAPPQNDGGAFSKEFLASASHEPARILRDRGGINGVTGKWGDKKTRSSAQYAANDLASPG
jgi:hypothetical protein